jgi:hypothetical protein
MGSPDWLRFILNPLITNNIMTPILTWGVLLFEMVLFLAIAMSPKQQKKILVSWMHCRHCPQDREQWDCTR